MRILVATVAHEEELVRARKHLGYDLLVVVVPRRAERALAAAITGLAKVRVEEVAEDDLLACLERLQAIFAEFRRHEVRAAVDGGTSAMSAAGFLACLSEGVEAWFLLKEPVRLPVLQARPIGQRFGREELLVLRALDRRASHEELARRTGLPLPAVRDALLAFKKQGAVASGADWAEPTELGRFYRRALPAQA
ncbi:MAG TPA: hypothetical protein VGR28_08020 [Candidatus Thermoplasmatota archaeon]|jgi:hypothetical protein|nr:hypothetical protein [Candidatus Thermoplasmatota archaeon]